MFDWKNYNGLLDRMAEVENFGFDFIVQRVSFYLVLKICMHYGF